MKFVSTDNLKTGMRLAKPIYNKTGVMLYERDTKLTMAGIDSIKKFGLIGIYVLDAAEPVPPMTEEDREFERFQTMSVFSLQAILEDIQKGKQPAKLEVLVAEIMKIFGKYQGKITFNQNLRSIEDNVYKHSLNVAILAAAISGKMNMNNEQQRAIVIAALLHDVGSLDVPEALMRKDMGEYTDDDRKLIAKYREDGYKLLRENCDFESDVMKNISYLLRNLKDPNMSIKDTKNIDMSVEILKCAYMFDVLTAMKYGEEPKSDIAAYKFIKNPVNGIHQEVVRALTVAINIVPSGCTVLFENGERGIVLTENEYDILRPFILLFKDNRIYNLADSSIYKEYKIKDVLKTLDNRYMMVDKYKEYMEKLGNGEVR